MVRRVLGDRLGGRPHTRARRSGASPAPVPQRPPLHAALRHVFDTALAGLPDPGVALVARGPRKGVQDLVRELRPDARLVVVPADLEATDRHLALAAATPIDLLVDSSGKAATPGRMASLLRYVHPGGVLVGALGTHARESGAAEREEYAAALRSGLGPAVSSVTVLERHVVAVSALERHPIIREAEVARLLELRPGLGRVLDVRQARHVRARGSRRMNRSDLRFPVIDEWTTPPLALREYHDVVSGPGQVVRAGDLLLPESFRHVFRPRVKNNWLAPRPMNLFADPAKAVLPEYAETPPATGPRHLAGSWFHLDNELRGHFGHTTTEVLAKVWGWHEARRADPTIRALLHANRHDAPTSWELDLLEAAGVPRDDIVFTRDPVRVDRLVSATPMFGNPRYAHPDLVGTWQAIADELEAGATLQAPERIFISRRAGGWRPCHNLEQVEAFFEDLGYTVVHPEDHPLGDQVRLFRHSRAIAGFAGSGMFGLMWVAEPKPVTMVASEAYPGRNEFLIAGLIGHDLDVVWSPAHTQDPETGERIRGVQAPFTVDLDRDADFIRRATGH